MFAPIVPFVLLAVVSRPCSAKVWWQFAGGCVLHFIQERNKHHTIMFAAQRARDIVLYVKVYTKHLTEANVDPASKVSVRPQDDFLMYFFIFRMILKEGYKIFLIVITARRAKQQFIFLTQKKSRFA